jgi:hypothetical protein
MSDRRKATECGQNTTSGWVWDVSANREPSKPSAPILGSPGALFPGDNTPGLNSQDSLILFD